jgi:uracil-DNA glycosylase
MAPEGRKAFCDQASRGARVTATEMTTAETTTDTWACERTAEIAPARDMTPRTGQFIGVTSSSVCPPARARCGTGLRGSGLERVATHAATSPADISAAPVPDTRDVDVLRKVAATCRACPLWRNATQTVFGEGPARARVLVVGEQPGDQEDRAGHPFVGPAGRLLDRAFEAAGVDRSALFITNAVKHFKWVPRGKRRLHEKPNSLELAACRPWLEAEIRAVQPEVIVCLGATAARAVVGRVVRVLSERGQRLDTDFGVPALITIHPSALLRLRDRSEAAAAFDALVADLKKIEAAPAGAARASTPRRTRAPKRKRAAVVTAARG